VFGVAAAPAGAVILGALVMAILLTVAWLTDRRALLLWGSVGGYVLVTLGLVAYGRFELFGSIFTTHYHYWSDLSIPLALAVVLTACRVRPRLRFIRWAPAVAVCCLLAWTTGAVVSDAAFAHSWDNNPARPYFATLTAELDQAGPAVNLWDTMMPPNVTTGIAADQRLSPVLRAARIPVNIQASGSEPYVIDQTGRLRPATFRTWSTAVPPPTEDKFCDLLMHGVGSVTLPLRSTLDGPPAESRWFARIGYFSNRETRLEVELIDAAGRELPMPVPSAAWPAGVSTMYFGPTAVIRAEAVRLRSTDPATNVCVGNVAIGLPEAER
jgi:hypothetical protein